MVLLQASKIAYSIVFSGLAFARHFLTKETQRKPGQPRWLFAGGRKNLCPPWQTLPATLGL
jgi:hypothetical protein